MALYTRLDTDTQHYREANATDDTQDSEAAQAQAARRLMICRPQPTNARSCRAARPSVFSPPSINCCASNRPPQPLTTARRMRRMRSAEAGASSPVIATLPQAGRSVALLKGQKLGDIITINDPMKVALELWLTQYRPNLMRAYENYEYLRQQMWPDYKKAGLPEALLFGILAQESGGKVHAVSSSGASGPLQFMSATGARFGLGVIDGFDQRFDPGMSARANAAYINEQLGVFNDNLELALAAYNGGEGAMRRLAARYPNAGFWDPKIYFSVSPETRNYVPMVLAAAWLFLHPERYNLSFPPIDNKPASVALAVPASIDELTICLGQRGNQRWLVSHLAQPESAIRSAQGDRCRYAHQFAGGAGRYLCGQLQSGTLGRTCRRPAFRRASGTAARHAHMSCAEAIRSVQSCVGMPVQVFAIWRAAIASGHRDIACASDKPCTSHRDEMSHIDANLSAQKKTPGKPRRNHSARRGIHSFKPPDLACSTNHLFASTGGALCLRMRSARISCRCRFCISAYLESLVS